MQMDIFVEFALVTSDFFDKKDANHHESRIVWSFAYAHQEMYQYCIYGVTLKWT